MVSINKALSPFSGEGMAGALFWQDFISLARSVGFSTPYLVSASLIVVHNHELKEKSGRICPRFFSPATESCC